MHRIKELKKYLYLIGGVILLFTFVFIYFRADDDFIIEDDPIGEALVTTTESVKDSIFVDVKGAVKKPGVYEFNHTDKVIDAVSKAGGLKSDADTSNINLSKRLSNEMVIYIFTKKELKTTTKDITTIPASTSRVSTTKITSNKITTASTKSTDDVTCKCETIEINNCIEKDNNQIDDYRININTASLEELMTLTGIGEARAKSIIEYREQNGMFRIASDIVNVSGISETMYDKIKDNIKV